MKLSTWKHLLHEGVRALALILVLVSVLAAGVAHAHVDGVKADTPAAAALAPPHDAASGGADLASAVASHCSAAASCHNLFLVSALSGTFEPESESVEAVPLQYSAPPAPFSGLFRPPRRG